MAQIFNQATGAAFLLREARLIEDSTYVNDAMTIVPSGMFQNYLNLTTIYLPNVVEIGDNAFNGCTQLTLAEFPKVTKVGNSAFLGCTNLTTVAIFDHNNTQPTETGSIGLSAFHNCTNLSILYLGLDTPPTLAGANPNSVFSATLLQNSTVAKGNIYVNADVSGTYRAAAIWSANNLKSKIGSGIYSFPSNNS